jgi:HlyD family secretion protein
MLIARALGIALVFVIAPLAVRAQTAAPASAVTVTKVVKSCFDETVDVTGQLVPKEEVQVRPDREGLQISQILVEAGDNVTSGQALARLSPPGDGQGAAITVQAPVAGIIRKISAVVGTTASARAEPLFQIIAQGEIDLQAEAVTSQLAKLALNQPARVKVVGASELRGQVRFISTVVDPMTQLGSVRIAVTDSKGLRAGSFARASVVTAQRCGVAIPLSAILYSRDGAVVQTVRNERVESRPVTIGLLSKGAVEIQRGLNEGELVVQKAGAFLREGDRVMPITAEPAGARK